MSRRRAWIWLTLALVSAVAAGGLSFYLLQQSTRSSQATSSATVTPQPAPTAVPGLPIPVASSDLEAGRQLSSGDYTLKLFPLELLPSNAITSPSLLERRSLAQPVARGDFFRPAVLQDHDGTALSSLIEPGKTVLAFPIIDLLGQSDVINAGDAVDLLITLPPAEGQSAGRSTGYTVQNVRVLQVLRSRTEGAVLTSAPTALLLLLDPADAVMVKFVKDHGGIIDLALRAPVDTQPFRVAPVNEQEMRQRFSFERLGGP